MQHTFLDPDLTYKRLLSEYEKYGSIVVAFDFDNTVFDYHKQGLIGFQDYTIILNV